VQSFALAYYRPSGEPKGNDEALWKKDKNALFKILSSVDPKQVEDTDALAACEMESYADTPTYEG